MCARMRARMRDFVGVPRRRVLLPRPPKSSSSLMGLLIYTVYNIYDIFIYIYISRFFCFSIYILLLCFISLLLLLLLLLSFNAGGQTVSKYLVKSAEPTKDFVLACQCYTCWLQLGMGLLSLRVSIDTLI